MAQHHCPLCASSISREVYERVLKISHARKAEGERAQAAFHKKEIAKRDGQVATSEYHGALKAERDKTEKLRALRLAKEAADAEAAKLKGAEQPAKPAPKAKKKRG